MESQSQGKPTREEVLSQLKDIETSRRLTPQQLKILQYVVDEELAARGKDIKAWSVAVHGLGRPPSFEPKEDKIVAIQVSRLRNGLRNYYSSSEGWKVRVKIEIPIPGYRPVLSYPDPKDQFDAATAAALRSAQIAMDRLTLPEYQKALRYLDQILLKHPEHPIVLAIKADVHCYRAMHGMPPRHELETAEKLAKRALEQSPGLWQAQIAYGYVQAVFQRWEQARDAFDRAAKAPKAEDGLVHPSYTAFLVSQAKTDEAVRLMEHAVEISGGYYGLPAAINPIVRSDLAFLQILAGKLEDAKGTLESALNDSDFYILYVYLSMLRAAEDDPKGAVDVLSTAPLKWSESTLTWGLKGLFHGLAGAKWHARLELAKLLALRKLGFYVPASQFAIAYLGLGKHQDAIKWVRQMAMDCDPLFLWLGHFPFLRHLAYLPEFHILLKELGLEWQWSRRGAN